MLELSLAAFLFLGMPLLVLGYMAFVKSQEPSDPLEDLKNWGSHDVDRCKHD